MTNATAVADEVESELAPLHEDVSNAWWALNILSNEENERRRVELETALSDFLADGERFAAIEAARQTADGMARRRLDLLLNAFLPQQIPTETRTRIIELEASVDARFSQHRGDIAGRKVDDNEIRRILRESDNVEERRAAWRRRKRSARSWPATCVSSPGFGTRPPTRSASATGSRSRSPRPRWTSRS